MVFNCKGFFDDDIEEAALIRVEKKKVADHHEYPKKTSRKQAPDSSKTDRSKVAEKESRRRDGHNGSSKPPSVAAVPASSARQGENRVEEQKLARPSQLPKDEAKKTNFGFWQERLLNPSHEVGGFKMVLKTRLHCQGCIQKVRRYIEKFEGVKLVAMEADQDLVTVAGNFGYMKELVPYLKNKLKQEVEVVPIRSSDDRETVITRRNNQNDRVGDQRDSNDKKAEESVNTRGDAREYDHKRKPTVKSHEKEKNQNLPIPNLIEKDQSLSHEKTRSSTLRIRLHCKDCQRKIDQIIAKFKGVNSVSFRTEENLATVIGNFDLKELVAHLQKKLKHGVELVPTRKTDDKSGDKEGRAATGNETNINGSIGMTANVREGGHKQWCKPPRPDSYRWNEKNLDPSTLYWNDGIVPTDDEQNYGPSNQAWGFNRITQSPITEMFSDENPNACTIL